MFAETALNRRGNLERVNHRPKPQKRTNREKKKGKETRKKLRGKKGRNPNIMGRTKRNCVRASVPDSARSAPSVACSFHKKKEEEKP